MAEDTERIIARAERDKAEAERLEKQADDVRWQVDMLLGFTLGKLLGPPPEGC
ncbi:hypothetical protein [Streptomyces caniscabiei]|uniref:hypothetical protein n=1 Tax=Streptomyces caniscabiei TaxID=2746961 RepID=UPI0038F6438E